MAIAGLHNDTVRVAYQSIALDKCGRHPFAVYINYWIAFNNCYVFLLNADRQEQDQAKNRKWRHFEKTERVRVYSSGRWSAY
jgi:hypothetical protein